MKITTKEIRNVTSLLDEIIEYYKEQSSSKERDWRTYEQRYVERVKTAIRELRPLIVEATNSVNVVKGETRGAKSKLSLEQKVMLVLLKHLFGKSNRMMANMLAIFSMLTDIDISYKTIERLYSDQEIVLALHNLHALMLKKKGISEADTGGDGTGYTLNIKEHYATEAQKLKDKKSTKKKKYLFSFNIIDISTRMYIAYGTSFKSERKAYEKTSEMAKKLDITITTIRLDRYFSNQKTVKELKEFFPGITITLIPKKNVTVKGHWGWKRMLHDFCRDPMTYLEEYFQRNQSESGFAEDKKRTGWRIMQIREERADTANFMTLLWHNLFWLAD